MKILSYDIRGKKSAESMKDIQTVLKILSNKNRFAIMQLLFCTPRDLCVHELSEKLNLSQSATSHQLAFLEMCGVVQSVRDGKTKCYFPTDTQLAEKVHRVIKSLTI